MKLTATWKVGRDPSVDTPDSIKWEDGRWGTVTELHAHNRDTYLLTHPDDGTTQMVIYPEIVAEVSYCDFGCCWGLKGDGVGTAALSLRDPNATDQQIYSALYALPMKYRVNIKRKPILAS